MNLQKYKYNFNFFNWIKKTELVELQEININDDPIRPELSNEFRTSQGRKITNKGIVHLGYTVDDNIQGKLV